MIDFDLTTRPSRPSGWHGLVCAILDGDETDESHWLEFKSRYDWTKSVDLGNLSRHIIGLANRDPLEAAASLGGSGVVVVGLEPGTVHGVVKIDPADLESKITPYLGPDGPRWEPRWVKIDEVDVLVLEVDAPRIGDPPYSLERSFGNYSAGQIFVRTRGATKPATQLQIQALARRFVAIETQDRLEVEVGCTVVDPISVYYWTETEIESFLTKERRDLLISLEQYEGKPVSSSAETATKATLSLSEALAGGPSVGSMTEQRAENRTPEEYRAQIERYLAETRDTLPDFLNELVVYLVKAPVFWVSNLSGRNYRDVEVTLRVEGLARAEDAPYDLDDVPDIKSALPRRPRTYGPYTAKSPYALAIDSAIPRSILAQLPANSFPASYTPSRRSIQNGGSFRIELDQLDLRPSQERVEIESEVVVLIPRERNEPVLVHWHATASNVDAVAEGEFVMPTDGEPLNVFASAIAPDQGGK